MIFAVGTIRKGKLFDPESKQGRPPSPTVDGSLTR